MDMIVIDIGNSTFSLGAFAKEELGRTLSLPISDADQLPRLIRDLRAFCGPQPHDARTVPIVISSVNAPALAGVETMVSDLLDQRVAVIGRDIPVAMKVAVEQPETVGLDRLLTAQAAYDMLSDAVVVADFGSATTIDCVNHQGIFLGGAILPGLGMAARALREHTAALPLVDIIAPEGDYGINTVSAIQHGILYGAAGALRELVERYATHLGRWPQVIVTGGYGPLVAEKCDFVDHVVPTLCLTGIYLNYLKNRFAQTEEQAEKE